MSDDAGEAEVFRYRSDVTGAVVSRSKPFPDDYVWREWKRIGNDEPAEAPAKPVAKSSAAKGA